MPRQLYSGLQFFALFNVALIFYASIWPVSFDSRMYGWAQAEVLLLVQIVVSAAIFYAAGQARAGRDIGHKALPASVVSYLLWLGMLRFWLQA